MLTSKQRSYLRGLAAGLQPIFQIGKGGVTDTLITQLYEALEARELIKITVLNNSELEPKAIIAELAERTSAEPVTAIGSKIVLYKPSRKHPKIELPR